MYASTIESFLYVPWIPYLQRLTSISETEPHLAVLYNHPQFPEVIVIKNQRLSPDPQLKLPVAYCPAFGIEVYSYFHYG